MGRTPSSSPAFLESESLFVRATTTASSVGSVGSVSSSAFSQSLSGDTMSKRDLVVLLHRAKVEAARAKARHYLIKHGFKDDDVNSRKRTRLGTAFTYPLHVAANHLDEAMIRTLLKLGANRGAVDSAGNTALRCVQLRQSSSCFSSGKAADCGTVSRILDLLQGWKSDAEFAQYPLIPDGARMDHGPRAD